MGGRGDLGERVRSDYRCGACGYGVVAVDPPPACPMCRESAWEHAPWRPFSARAGSENTLVDELAAAAEQAAGTAVSG